MDINACNAFWATYLRGLPQTHQHRSIKPDAFAFGGGGALADELAQLVLLGKKRATASLAIEFTSLNEPIPDVGSISIILDGSSKPVAIIERTSVKTVPFNLVDEEFAAMEGEGDGSLAYWRQAHFEYFTDVCERYGAHFDAKTPVLCQTFKLLWPVSSLRGPSSS